jgi:hypothetical protein
MLTCESYDDEAIDHIEINDVPSLEAYVNGEERIDANGKSYYWYNTSKLIKNMTITVYYSNGTSTTATGVDSIDGYDISYVENQYENHWYPSSAEEYTENTFTVKILNSTASCNVDIVIGARYSVKGIVLNFAGEPIQNVAVALNGTTVAYTDANGKFSFYSDAGIKSLTLSTDTSIDLTKLITITASASGNDFTETPFYLCNCDYVKDGYINAKDFAYISNNFTGSELDSIKEEFEASINFSQYD